MKVQFKQAKTEAVDFEKISLSEPVEIIHPNAILCQAAAHENTMDSVVELKPYPTDVSSIFMKQVLVSDIDKLVDWSSGQQDTLVFGFIVSSKIEKPITLVGESNTGRYKSVRLYQSNTEADRHNVSIAEFFAGNGNSN